MVELRLKGKLNPRQLAFVDHYIACGNATEAALKAGYSPKTAAQTGSENLKKPHIQAYVDERMGELASRRIANATETLEHLTAAMRGEVDEEVLVVEGVGDGVSRARVLKKQIAAKDRLKAAELLGKRFGLYTDKIAVDGDLPVRIVVDIPCPGGEEDPPCPG